jgi:hypothetical protein
LVQRSAPNFDARVAELPPELLLSFSRTSSYFVVLLKAHVMLESLMIEFICCRDESACVLGQIIGR